MPPPDLHQTPIQACLIRLAAGDLGAREELLQISRGRLLAVTRRWLDRCSRLRRWVESEDVLQNSLIRLDRAMDQIPLEKTTDFFAIAATNIRREVHDLLRHYFGNHGVGANHDTPGPARDERSVIDAHPDGDRNDPAKLAEFAELLEAISSLPQAEREAIDLHEYLGLTLKEVAEVLGTSTKTVSRRLAAAKLRLGKIFDAGT
jgi:RNA polymerase sigma factor (sigma-70 family)